MLAATILIALATVAYAIVASLQLKVYREQKAIADQQRRAAEQNLRIALYDKRLKVFRALAGFMADAAARYDVSNDELRELLRNTAEIEFLFPREIIDYMRDVYHQGNALHTAVFKLGGSKESFAEREALVAESRRAMDWLEAELNAATDKFRPYLDFSKI